MPNPVMHYPANFTPVNGLAYANTDNTAQTVSATSPLPVTVVGGGGGGGVGGAVTLADGASVALGAMADAAASSDTGAFSLIALTKRLLAKLPASVGQKPMAQSLSVSLASDQGNLEPGGAAVTGQAMPSGGLGLTGWLSGIYSACSESAVATASATSAAVVMSGATQGYQGGSFHVTSVGTGNTIVFEQSNDNTNWVAMPMTSGVTANAAPFTSTSTAGFYYYTSSAAYVRARVSVYGSGTVTLFWAKKLATPPVLNQVLATGSNTVGNVNVSSGYTDSTTALGAGAAFTGTSRATSSSAPHSYFNAYAFADQAGTLYIDVSFDTGATFQQVASVAVVAGSGQSLSARLVGAFTAATIYRVRFVNGATAQATFRIASSFTAN